MRADDFFSLVDKYKKNQVPNTVAKKRQELASRLLNVETMRQSVSSRLDEEEDEDIAPVKMTETETVRFETEEEDELLAGMTPTQRRFHEKVGGFVDTSKTWGEKIDAVTKRILAGEDEGYAETDKLLKQLKNQQEMVKANDTTWEKEYTEYQGYYNQLITAKNRDILSKTKMDGSNKSVLQEMQELTNLSGDEKEKRKEAVLKKMDELGIPKSDYAMFTDDKNFTWDSFGKWVDYSFGAGLNSFNKGIASTADLILGKPLQALGWEDNPISQTKEYYEGLYNMYAQGQDLYAQKLGGGAGWEFASDAAEGTIGAIPNMLLAFASSGASTDLSTKAAYEVGDWLTKAGIRVSSMLKNPNYWMSFVRTYGTDYEEAKAKGADDFTALIGSTVTSLVNAGIEIGVDGGSGIQGLTDDILADKNKLWAWVESFLEEGGEGGLQKFVGELVTKAMYDHDAEILNPLEYAKEMAIGTVSGMALGGGQIAIGTGANAYNEYQANKLTGDEITVYDKLVDDAIKAKEKDGTKLTTKEKSDIKKGLRRDLENGSIKVEQIEEVLGGESYNAFKGELDNFFGSEDYKAYQEAVKGKASIQEEYDAIGEKGATNLAEMAHFNDLHQQMKDYNKTIKDMESKLSPEATRISQLRDSMRGEVSNRVKDSRLAESYRELARSKEKYTVDVNQYTNKHAKQTVQNIFDSGLGDNTNKFHHTVDFLAKLSADKGVTFTLTNNEKLKGTKHYKKGFTTNGFVITDENGKTITLNMDSDVALNTTAGHEIVHVMEGNNFYGELKDVVFKYAETKEGLDKLNARIKEAEENYRGDTNTTPEAEVVADLIGEYVFTDYDFVHNLSVNNRNVFQKVYDEIKYMVKIATAGSKEARELEKVKKMFDKAYRESAKSDNNTKYSLENGNKSKYNKRSRYSETETQFLSWENGSAPVGEVKKFSRYGKTRYYEKTENGCVELSRSQYNERTGVDVEKNYRRAERRLGTTVNHDESAQRGSVGDHDSYRDNRGASAVFGQAFRERLSDDTTGSVSSTIGYDSRDSINQAEYNDEASGNPGASFVTFSNDYATIRNFMKDGDTAEVDVQYSLVKDQKTIDFLENQDHLTVYKAMQIIDGKLYPPMSAEVETTEEYTNKKGETKTRKVRKLKQPSELGKWQQSDERPDLVTNFAKPSKKYPDGYGRFDLLKGTGDKSDDLKGVAYNPYEHTSNIVLNDQFSSAYRRDNLVTVEYHIPKSELTSGYKAQYAKDSVGLTDWKAGGVAQKLKNSHRDVYLTRWAKPVRVLDDAEVAQKYKEILDKEDGIAVPWNVVTPNLLAELQKAGVPIDYSDVKFGSAVRTYEAAMRGEYGEVPNTSKYSLTKDSQGKELSEEQVDFFKDSKAVDTDGNLVRVYHGTRNADFTVFKRNATYYTDSKEMADSYSPNGDMYEGYVNITKPYEIDAKGEKWSRIPIDEDTKEFLERYGSSVFEEDGSWRTSPADIVSAIEEAIDEGKMDYDGIIIRNVDDTGSYYKDKDSHLATDYITFESKQFKNVDNTKPTADPDIRFSLSKPVEETKDLIALHNLKADELLKSFDLGGFPMPSIAVIKADAGHEQYGDISLVFPKDTIDPKKNKANKVYGGDAWTPTYPRMEYKPSETVARRVSDKYYELADKFGYDEAKPLYQYQYEMEDVLNKAGGEANLLERLYNDTNLMELYLLDSGKGKVEPVTTETVTKMTDAEIEMNEYIVNAIGKDVLSGFKTPNGHSPMTHHNAFMAEHDAEIRAAYRGYFVDVHGFTETEADNVANNTSKGQMLKTVRNAYQYTQNSGVTVKTETDYEATREAIRNAAEDGYKEWVDGLFKGVEEKTGIRNNVETYTSSGYQRSWDALHWENTLENVVKAMKAQDQTGADAMFGVHKIFSTSAKEYSSIEDIKKDSDRLRKIPQEEYEEAKSVFENRFADIASRLMDKKHYNSFVAKEQAMEGIVDAVRSSKTKNGIYKKLKEYGMEVTESDVDDIVSLVNDIANMPTGYFEAKPQRAVGFDEVAVYVIPRNADIKLKQELLNRGYNIAEYDPDIEGDRQKVVNQLDDYKFSLSSVGKEPNKSGDYHVYGSDFGYHDPLAAFDAPIREDVAETVEETDATPTAPVTEEVETSIPDVEDVPHEDTWEESFDAITDEDVPPVQEDTSPAKEITTVQEKIQQKIKNTQAELDKNRQYRDQAVMDYDAEIATTQAELDSKKNKDSKLAQALKRRIERLNRLKADINADYGKRINDLESRLEKLHSKEYGRAEHRRAKQEQYTEFWENLIGDTSTWKDMALGLSYKTKTLRRILRNVVRGADGKADIRLADDIYDELETKYDHNEALLKRESQNLKEVFQKLKLNQYEDTYAHMAGEFRHNPDTTLTVDMLQEYYEKHKNKINVEKVNTAIKEARKTFDDLIVRVNKVLKEQGFKEIPYRQGYFPHFQNPKQGWLAKLLNWKTVDNEIPTSIAGLTEAFKPQRSWQKFDKQRKGDNTDYSLYQGLDTYIHGALDWIYHIEDLQKRRSLENYIRYTHSEEGVKERINEIKANEYYDADEAQDMINAVLDEANNPLSGLVRELMNRTNTLANKKSSMDRGMEDATNRKIYSTMTNLNNRINANMVVGSFSSALTNFIPMVQSWHQVSPYFTVRGLGDFIRSTVKDDGMIAKSDYLTNRLVDEEKLYQTTWDKVSDKAAFLMSAIDNITSQTVWRSKYLQNIKEGMSESYAIKDADQFAKNLMAGRSRGNAPTIFDAKNPIVKIFTAFQLEVANQYGYMFEDTPQDVKNKARLVKGYATAFLGSYLFNALYSSLVGRDAAFDPIGIIEDLLKDLGVGDDDDEEEVDAKDALLGLGENIIQEIPFVGGLVGGGRIPLSSALPYSSDSAPFESMLKDVTEGNWDSFGKEFLKPLYYLAMPVGGGQIKKTVEGLGMFDDDLPVAGSYTDSGKLRFPVEKDFGNVVQAAMFGQYASKNAREYFDEGYAPLGEKQIQEYMDVDIPISDYWKYREGLKGKDTLGEKLAYINTLDLPIRKQNILANNQADRKEPIDMRDWDSYDGLEEFDYAKKYPEKYQFLEANGITFEEFENFDEDTKDAYNWAYQNPKKYAVSKAVAKDVVKYKTYTKAMSELKADKDEFGNSISGSRKEKVIDYINGLDLDYGEKIVLLKSQYPSDDTYNGEIFEYVNGRNDLSYEDKIDIFEELGYTVMPDGTVFWD